MKKVSRRALLAGAAGLVAAGKTAAMQAPESSSDPSKVRGKPSKALGQRAPSEKPQRQVRSGAASGTPHQDLCGTITPADLHFERHHAGLTSTSEWTGVALATLFREVGARPQAKWFLAEGQDAALLTRSIPVARAYDDALIAYGQNGEAIRPEQGYPARLFLPGWEGNSNVKWLRRIELSDRPFMTREETSKYTDPMADGTARIFSFLMDARSLITYPAYPVTLSRGWVEINGIAWTGSGKIARVDVSTDGGTTWSQAKLQEPVLSKAHTRFRHLWNWTGGEAVIMSRAVDEAGSVQATRTDLIASRGVSSVGYHLNPITGWLV